MDRHVTTGEERSSTVDSISRNVSLGDEAVLLIFEMAMLIQKSGTARIPKLSIKKMVLQD